MKEAKERGCITTWDLIGATEETIAIVKPLLPHIDYFMPSIEEASIMCGLSQPEDVAKFYLDGGVKNCVLTMGGEGSLFMNNKEKIITPAFDIEVVDTYPPFFQHSYWEHDYFYQLDTNEKKVSKY